MTDRAQDPQLKSALESKGSRDSGQEDSVFLAALRATAFMLPTTAVSFTVLLYVVSGEINVGGFYEKFAGGLAVLVGMVAAILVWLIVARFYQPYTSAASANRRNYNALRERLDYLKIRVKQAKDACSQDEHEDGMVGAMRQRAIYQAEKECEDIEERLAGKGMRWVTGLGYIELWHRVHRAEEALIKAEPYVEALEGAMRDQSRLIEANIANRNMLLSNLNWVLRALGEETGEAQGTFEGQDPSPSKENPAVLENRPKALLMLSEVRYEINNFRDNSWEGLVNLRNRLADTVVLLGLTTYALLAFAIFLEAPPETIIWAVTYFLIGAIAGLFARAQSEWGAETAVDDFGLSKMRLMQIPWLAGMAAFGGVVVTSILESIPDTATLATIFQQDKPILLVVAAVFGLTPDLIIRRLAQQVDKYKGDLQSTQSSQSIQDDSAVTGNVRVS